MEVWFYHLQRQPLEAVLPTLVERTRARGWTAVIQTASAERLQALDDLLWTYNDSSFLAHGSSREGDGALQPVWLTAETDNPNSAAVRFFVEGADAPAALADPQAAPTERAIVLFDGRDEDALNIARMQFRTLREKGFALSYWRQSEDGRWEKTA
ncbi:MAG: DNA polymerase III subunit chi [Hyphomicrobiales bacterium]|nr:DNA polymerase III subunit chi [Hyphomicrobiales bacterium]